LNHRPYALDGAELARSGAKDRAGIAVEFLEQAVERDGADVWQGVQHEERLRFG
jgi:hypothetical protein